MLAPQSMQQHWSSTDGPYRCSADLPLLIDPAMAQLPGSARRTGTSNSCLPRAFPHSSIALSAGNGRVIQTFAVKTHAARAYPFPGTIFLRQPQFRRGAFFLRLGGGKLRAGYSRLVLRRRRGGGLRELSLSHDDSWANATGQHDQKHSEADCRRSLHRLSRREDSVVVARVMALITSDARCSDKAFAVPASRGSTPRCMHGIHCNTSSDESDDGCEGRRPNPPGSDKSRI